MHLSFPLNLAARRCHRPSISRYVRRWHQASIVVLFGNIRHRQCHGPWLTLTCWSFPVLSLLFSRLYCWADPESYAYMRPFCDNLAQRRAAGLGDTSPFSPFFLIVFSFLFSCFFFISCLLFFIYLLLPFYFFFLYLFISILFLYFHFSIFCFFYIYFSLSCEYLFPFNEFFQLSDYLFVYFSIFIFFSFFSFMFFFSPNLYDFYFFMLFSFMLFHIFLFHLFIFFIFVINLLIDLIIYFHPFIFFMFVIFPIFYDFSVYIFVRVL
jgi:hypothetical protein